MIHLYQDIFVLKVYLQRDITLPDHSVVIDGGANIGMRETGSIVGAI